MATKALATLLVLLACTSLCPAEPFVWQEPQAKVIPTGDLQWSPRAFRYTRGRTIRYIDYENGDDANAGTAPDTAWKHHPWDPQATSRAKTHGGPTMYVFKGGSTYRGTLKPDEHGTAAAPIRLTRDPNWGEGPAAVYGSRRIRGGWKRGAEHARIPQAGKVWWIDLDFLPRNVWLTDGEEVTRFRLAREPNWEESDPQDPMSEWWQWEQPRWWEGQNKTEIDGRPYHLAVDTKHLTGTAEDYVGATVWTEWGIVMGSPYPHPIKAFYPDLNAVTFGGPWVVHASEQIITGNRYYLEDRPFWLDSPGEFWFDRRSTGGRLYVRLPGDADPNQVVLEAAEHIHIIEAQTLRHVEISGLTFRFTNVFWDFPGPRWSHPDKDAAVIRVREQCEGLTVRHCTFEHVHLPLRVQTAEKQKSQGIAFTDNDVSHTDFGGVHIQSARPGAEGEPGGINEDVSVLRNRFRHTGWRVNAGRHGHTVWVQSITAHVAGNMLHRTGGWGISVTGIHRAKATKGTDVPFARYLVHHNRVEDCLLKSCDWGAFYITTHGGPSYIYSNVAINPVGQMHWAKKRLGYAYYLDGGYKCVVFNNIAEGYDYGDNPARRNTAAFQSMVSFENVIFNNTAHRFTMGSKRQSPQGSREQYLGNVFLDMSNWVLYHAKAAKSPAEANEAHVPMEDAAYQYETNAYANNVIHGQAEHFGCFEQSGMPYESLQAMAEALAERDTKVASIGVVADQPPLRDPDGGDFRPAPGGAAIDRGVRVFVPWGLASVVGEWHFTPRADDATLIDDKHWYQTPYYAERGMYRTTPRYPLRAVGVTRGDFVPSPVEDWIDGALCLDGEGQYAVLKHAQIAAPFLYTVQGDATEYTVAPEEKKTVDIDTGDLLVEAHLRTTDADGVLVRKMQDGVGYELVLKSGRPRLRLRDADGAELEATGRADLSNGRWRHLLVEVDRDEDVRMYVDGKTVAVAGGAIPQGSLRNEGDFLVGGGPGLEPLSVTLDFLRVARGTLRDARTTIEELHTWQFHGPQYRDFRGREPVNRRDAGAIEQGE